RRIARGKAIVDPDILPYDPPEVRQRLTNRRHACASFRVVLRLREQHADTAQPLGLLGMPAERPRCHPAERGDELASSHSMTSSARARIDGGTVRPSAFAILRLTTSSKVVGCCTGRSAGLVPLRIRLT